MLVPAPSSPLVKGSSLENFILWVWVKPTPAASPVILLFPPTQLLHTGLRQKRNLFDSPMEV
jgi:hypothetical protein